MTVTIKLQNTDGTIIGTFPAEDNQSIVQIAKTNGIEIPTSCGIGACAVCKCNIISGNKYIQIDKISLPMLSLDRNDDGTFKEVFTCIGGISSEAFKDKEDHEIILEKTM
ncbi:MAG: 2Fe-2S iron-sulfur cluster binding domain-containing protein [candidate division SR1 bacterium]|nr:2Fe-2S iron-sulfur cluster binding domain-containing protein [candidate division SR1 bacterium]